MVDMRGGLDSLGLDGLLKTMILWYEYLTVVASYKFSHAPPN
jgi:hypothetical protein